MTELTSAQQAAVDACDQDLLLRGPPVSGRTTVLLAAGERIMDRESIFASRVWCVASDVRTATRWRTLLGRHHALSGAEILEPGRWLRAVDTTWQEFEGSPEHYARAKAQKAVLTRLSLPAGTLSALGLMHEGQPVSVQRPLYPPNDYSMGYQEKVHRLTADYEHDKRQLEDLAKHTVAVFKGQKITREDHLLWACHQLHNGQGSALREALGQRFGLVLVDDLEVFSPLERAFLRLLLNGSAVRLAVTGRLPEGPDVASDWTARLDQPLTELHLHDRFNRPEILLFARALGGASSSALLPARGPGGRVSPVIRVPALLQLVPHVQQHIELAAQEGQTLGILVPDHLNTIYEHLTKHQLGVERWAPRTWSFEATLKAGLRFVCGLSSPTGGHPLLDPAWRTLREAAGRKIGLSRTERATLHEWWRHGVERPSTHPLRRAESALGTCQTTREIGGVILQLQAATQPPLPQVEAFMDTYPDPLEALTVLTAQDAVPPPVFATLSEFSGHWDKVVLLLQASQPVTAEILRGVTAASEELHLLTFGDAPARGTSVVLVEQDTRPEREALLELLRRSAPPSADDMRRLCADPLTRHLYHGRWPLDVSAERREAWVKCHGEPSSWAALGPSKHWETRVTLLEDFGLL